MESFDLEPNRDDRTWGMLCHLSALSGFVIPFGNFLGPLFIWLLKKDHSSFVDDQGRESLNFQISLFIYAIALWLVSLILVISIIGWIFLPLILLFTLLITVIELIFIIMASIRANDGENYRYPYILQIF